MIISGVHQITRNMLNNVCASQLKTQGHTRHVHFIHAKVGTTVSYLTLCASQYRLVHTENSLTTCAAALVGPLPDMFLYSPPGHVTYTVSIRSHYYDSGISLLIKALHLAIGIPKFEEQVLSCACRVSMYTVCSAFRVNMICVCNGILY